MKPRNQTYYRRSGQVVWRPELADPHERVAHSDEIERSAAARGTAEEKESSRIGITLFKCGITVLPTE